MPALYATGLLPLPGCGGAGREQDRGGDGGALTGDGGAPGDTGGVSGCPSDAVACVDLADGRSAEDLAEIGGYAYAWTDDDVIIVVRVDSDSYVALSAVCTHQGCFVGYRADAGDLFCGCHASVFQLDGSVTAGPALTPLQVYTVEDAGDLLVITG